MCVREGQRKDRFSSVSKCAIMEQGVKRGLPVGSQRWRMQTHGRNVSRSKVRGLLKSSHLALRR